MFFLVWFFTSQSTFFHSYRDESSCGCTSTKQLITQYAIYVNDLKALEGGMIYPLIGHFDIMLTRV